MEEICQDIRSTVNEFCAGFYDMHFDKLFRGRGVASVLTPMEMLRLLAMIQATSRKLPGRHDLTGYITLVKELRRDERAMNAHHRNPHHISSAEPATPQISCHDASQNSPGVVTDVAATPNPRDMSSELTVICASDEYTEWFRSVGKTGAICSYLIHTKQFDLLEYAIAHGGYYRGPKVSKQLAAHGDHDGLNWMHANYAVTRGMWDASRIIAKATTVGHLHILIWVNQICQYDYLHDIRDWKLAVDGNHLHIIHWYFVQFPVKAKSLARIILDYAKSVQSRVIVVWMENMGLYPTV